MKKATFFILLLPISAFSQVKDTLIPKKWQAEATYNLNGTQTSFVNWSAGGRNNISALASIIASATYSKKAIKWANDLSLSLGGLKYLEKDSKEKLQKTDDKIDLSTNIGYKLKEHFYLSVLGGFKTQMLDGFSFPNDSVRISKFLAPGYVSLAVGIEYTPKKDLAAFLSPLAMKLTIVNDALLANSGAFGVEPAIFDLFGNVVTKGKRMRAEVGAYFKLTYKKNLAKNIDLKSKVELFSNYVVKPQNIDVNAEALFVFKVNSLFSASLQWNLLYDHDIQILDAKGFTGPRTQFKSMLGLGLSYKMKSK